MHREGRFGTEMMDDKGENEVLKNSSSSTVFYSLLLPLCY